METLKSHHLVVKDSVLNLLQLINYSLVEIIESLGFV